MFTDPDAVGSELPDRDPSTDCQFRECDRKEAGEEIEPSDRTVLGLFDE
jgi:hypothetical protein